MSDIHRDSEEPTNSECQNCGAPRTKDRPEHWQHWLCGTAFLPAEVHIAGTDILQQSTVCDYITELCKERDEALAVIEKITARVNKLQHERDEARHEAAEYKALWDGIGK